MLCHVHIAATSHVNGIRAPSRLFPLGNNSSPDFGLAMPKDQSLSMV
jgi:hypothetical protein